MKIQYRIRLNIEIWIQLLQKIFIILNDFNDEDALYVFKTLSRYFII